MLKQILANMYIDPELLEELSEEQKHILFFKMREEQIRRWKEREAIIEQNEALKGIMKPKQVPKKSVHWRLGTDQEVWVWVMGEHSSDKTYNVICDEIIAEQARKQAEKEAEEQRKAQEEELAKLSATLKLQTQSEITEKWKKSVEEARMPEQAMINKESQKKTMKLETHGKGIERLEERTQEIYMNWKEAQEVKINLEKEDSEWQETLKKSKAADQRRRSMAKQARDDYKRLSMQAIERGSVAEKAKSFGEVKRPPLPPKPKPATYVNNSGISRSERRQGVRRVNSGSTQENIIKWFKEEQLSAGFARSATSIAPWFHGIISRAESEDLLKSHVKGSFLVRISGKIKGYILSYRSEEGYMHFMIDASGTSYSFLGVDQLQHATLAELVEYHKTEPITSLGREMLLYPVGQPHPSCD
ncbi:SH2 domain-containing protein 4A [Spea bombifrons]|uniref:SH2 domain-containing protein 4A n=1 Tax=Spea bombifrons TaxID=233779 RepID=UPI00234A4E4C|nr:SH2 domain-containing protein 4A [Spea bombifrons]